MTKLTNLVMTNIFCQSLGLTLYRGSTVLNFIYLFFKKLGGPTTPPPPRPLPQRGPCGNMRESNIREYERRHNREDWIASVERLLCQTSALEIEPHLCGKGF